MPQIDLSILNQRQTPAFYADVFANRPAAGFVGRIFVSTNTFEFYRDNGTGWDLIGGPGTSTVTGTGANGQVTYWNGASSITGSNNLFFDAVNGHLGIGTITPGTALEIDHDQNTIIQLQQTVATNDNRITFINSGVGLWRIGSFYNAGANDFGLFDVAAAAQQVTVKRTTGQVLIGTSTVGSGKLVVASATGDNGVQIVGASAPSLRIDNAESGPTKRAGFGISTATNNFIQGSADRDFCMFNGSTTASPILFGIYDTINVAEAARISAARNFLVGTVTDSGEKFIVSGTANISGNTGIGGTNSSVARLYVRTENNANNPALTLFKNEFDTANEDILRVQSFENGVGVRTVFTVKTNGNAYLYSQLLIGTTTLATGFTTFAQFQASGTTGGIIINSATNNIGRLIFTNNNTSGGEGLIRYDGSIQSMQFFSNAAEGMRITSAGNLLIGTTTDAGFKLNVNGGINTVQAKFGSVANRGLTIGTTTVSGTNDAGVVYNAPTTSGGGGTHIFQTAGSERIRIKATGQMRFVPLSADPSLQEAGDVYYNSNTNKLRLYDGTNWVDLN
jgi:hypothetical protein